MSATQAHYRDYGKMDFARSVLVVHNMAHQGRGPMAELPPLEVGRSSWSNSAGVNRHQHLHGERLCK